MTQLSEVNMDMAEQTNDTVLEIEDLRVDVNPRGRAPYSLLHGVTLSLKRGEVLGVVGESGSGKSMTALAAIQLVPDNLTHSGSIKLGGEQLVATSERKLRTLRGSEIAMIFQDPMTGLNPVRSIGSVMVELLRRHQKMSKSAARKRGIEVLRSVGIPAAETRMNAYPHQLSGGLRQRVMIALALLNEPSVIVADEPTTALDSTIQAQILELLRKRITDAGLILITHDLDVAGDICDRIIVMYAGHVVEEGRTSDVLASPRHPYTAGLLEASPTFDSKKGRLTPIPGSPPQPQERIVGCPFAARCAHATDICRTENPVLTAGERTAAACWNPLRQ